MVRAPKQTDFSAAERQLMLAERALKNHKARESLLDFIEVLMPDPNHPLDVNYSRYEAKKHHKLIINMFEKFESGKNQQTALSIPPQHGKSTVTTHFGPAWALGRSPHKNIIVGGYGSDFIQKFGSRVRTIFESKQFRQIFPEFELKKGSKAKDYMETTAGGSILFVGRGEGTTGNPCDLFIIDDPIKDKKEADSPTMREDLWDWFTSVAETRCHVLSSIFVVHCLTGDTPVLMADGLEKLLKDVRAGDLVATYVGGKVSSSKVLNWKNQGCDNLFTIRMKSGISVRGNARHPFLVMENGEEIWRRMDLLKKGDHIRRVIGANGEVSHVGLPDAKNPRSVKGCAHPITIKDAGQTGIGPLQQARRKGARLICAIATGLSRRITSFFCKIRGEFVLSAGNSRIKKGMGPSGTANWLLTTATIPERSEGSSATNATSLSDMQKRKPFCGQPLSTLQVVDDEVVEIIQEGREDVFDIQVADTENFIANGLVSHNTRWHEDDLIGRLCDPEHPEYDQEQADDWHYINVPAIVDDELLAIALKMRVGGALWPERFPLELLVKRRRRAPKVFSALYQGKPTPDDGDFFDKTMIQYYTPDQLPPKLRIYAASDHAVTEKQENDENVFLVGGVDELGGLYLLDCWHGRKKTDVAVERMIDLMDKWHPIFWWAASDHISKSVGPFLRKRMKERRVHVAISESSEVGDKQQKAQSIQGRMAMGKVFFPKHAPWVQDLVRQLLRFPQATHDDFVDAISHLGRGINKMVNASSGVANDDGTSPNAPKAYTMRWLKQQTRKNDFQVELDKAMGGM